jgi:hypothetical protein
MNNMLNLFWGFILNKEFEYVEMQDPLEVIEKKLKRRLL